LPTVELDAKNQLSMPQTPDAPDVHKYKAVVRATLSHTFTAFDKPALRCAFNWNPSDKASDGVLRRCRRKSALMLRQNQRVLG